MIVRLTGVLAEVDDGSVVIERDGLGYEVLVPAYAITELAALRGQQVVLHTLDYIEGNAAGGNLIPRLLGFCHAEDRLFFQRFVTVKGMGMRKALRALTQPIGTIASAIENSETATLSKLPGIGKRGAEQIVATLRGKLGAFALTPAGGEPEHGWTQAQRDASSILVSLGERPNEAHQWLARAAQLHPELETAEQWMKAAFRIKSGAEG